MVWYSHLLKNFTQFVVIHTVKGFGIVNKAEVGIFSGKLSFFCDSMFVDNLVSGFFVFYKHSLYIWQFLVPVVLKPDLENFDHYFASVWDDSNFLQ